MLHSLPKPLRWLLPAALWATAVAHLALVPAQAAPLKPGQQASKASAKTVAGAAAKARAKTPVQTASPTDEAPALALSEADEQAAADVVRAQLAAFAADDAEKAFSYAAPSIRSTFGTAAYFLAMVRGHYPMVYRPTSIAFLKPDKREQLPKEAALLLKVHLTDRQDKPWVAVYQLQRQKNKSWRIAGCTVVGNDGRMV
jgi:hypothetical protein